MNYVYIAQSLDGYIAGPSGELDWLEEIDNLEKSDFGFSEFMNSVDALVMGKNTFEKVLSFDMWPYNKPVFVVSNSLKTLPSDLSNKAFLIKGSPQEVTKELSQKRLINLYVDGGLLIQSFLREGLIDELIVTTVPVILGGGIKLFGSLPQSIKLELISSEVLLNQLVKTRYRVKAA